jgi:hypothetical protein
MTHTHTHSLSFPETHKSRVQIAGFQSFLQPIILLRPLRKGLYLAKVSLAQSEWGARKESESVWGVICFRNPL